MDTKTYNINEDGFILEDNNENYFYIVSYTYPFSLIERTHQGDIPYYLREEAIFCVFEAMYAVHKKNLKYLKGRAKLYKKNSPKKKKVFKEIAVLKKCMKELIEARPEAIL